MTSTATELIVAAWPNCEPRLLRPSAGSDYLPLDDAEALLEQVDLSGLLGRGGAAFPLGTKLRTVRDAGRRGSETVVVANGEEGEPASVKDRWLLRNRPHVVLDTNGVLIEAIAMYRSSGYEPIERYNDNPHAELWFGKSLS